MAAVPTWLKTLTLFAALFLALMCAGSAFTLEPVRTASAAGEFNAEAARERLVRILGDEAPHPVDSPAHDRVRARLLGEIEALGFTPELREAFACRPQPRGPLVDCGRVVNIVFSLGPDSGPAVLAAAHYDSTPASPGASDDGIGISVWLEVARVLARAPLQRRVIFLFSDGEEQALLGAYAFASDDPLMEDVVALVNLEARGTRGPAVFFESNRPNSQAVIAYSAAPRPVANSVMADVYRLLPNSTDVSVLTRPGLAVINIALLEGLEHYHTPQDTIASQDLRSVQHMGDSALAAMRELSGAQGGPATEMAYTDIASRLFIYAPAWAVVALLAVSALVSFLAFWRAGPNGRWRAFAAPPLALMSAGALAFSADFIIRLLRPGADYAFAHPEPTRAWAVLFAFTGVLAALMVLRAPRSPQQMGAAGVFWFALLGSLASIVAGGISILFALPAGVYALAWLAALGWKPAENIGRWAAALVVLFVWAPTLFLVELALGLNMPLVFTLLVALLLTPWLGVLVQVHGQSAWRGVAGILGLAAIAALVISALTPAMSEARRHPLNLSYFLNASDGQARVLAGSAERALPMELQGAFEPEQILPGDRVQTWAAPAAIEPIPAPTLRDITLSEAGDVRVLRGNLAMNGAYRATLRIPLAAEPLRVVVSGVESDFDDTGGERVDFINVACQGRSCEGAEIEVVLGAGGDIDADWFIIGQTPGLHVSAAEAIRARRPETTTPIQLGDTAIALTRFRLGD